MKHELRITRDAAICGGVPVISGTRVPLRTVLACVAAGEDIATILREFPSLQESDVRAAIEFAAKSAAEDLPLSAHRVA